jgi:superfamily I DNA/RNA helicase
MAIKYIPYKDLMGSIRELYQFGGTYKKAAGTVQMILGRIASGDSDPFMGITLTNHGEKRIKHCLKYDLEGFCRLITIKDNGFCVLCYVGRHDDCDSWIEKNRGLTLTVNPKDQLTPVFVSSDVSQEPTRIKSDTDWSNGYLFAKIPGRYYDRIAAGVSRTVLSRMERLQSISPEEEILNLACQIEDSSKAGLFFDVFSLLRKGDIDGAKKRIDLFTNEMLLLENVTPERIEELVVGDSFIDFENFEPELIKHLVETASFQQWMLFMHPEQKKTVEQDFSGPVKLAGVSGSGKTCVIVKRAIRLARKYPGEDVLVLTLNRSLAKLIRNLIEYASPAQHRQNLHVMSFWQLCQSELRKFEPNNARLYDELTWKINEHVSEIWDEYYHCRLNNNDAEVLFPVHQSLLTRNVFPEDYINQEFDYIRSALGPSTRNEYLDLDRQGRALIFDRRFREFILKGLQSWEDKMSFVGVIDYLGLASALHPYLNRISPHYRCILVDEVQDFGTIELQIIRRLVKENENDIFLCGDVAQQVYTKHHKPASAGINISGRSFVIRKNYRNSREILSAAFNILDRNCSQDVRQNKQFEILEPEYANFSTPRPLLLQSDSLQTEFASAFNYLKEKLSSIGKQKKYCIALCGFSLNAVKQIGDALSLQVLDGSTDIDKDTIFLSDLEQTKGFEFDTMCIVNCNSGVLPNPDLPRDECYRELSKLYVAMTRAKQELILSYSGELSEFVVSSLDDFVKAKWSEHTESYSIPNFVFPVTVGRTSDDGKRGGDHLRLTGKEFLYTPEAVGTPIEVQDKMVELITGIDRSLNGTQENWSNIGHALESRHVTRMSFLMGKETFQRFRKVFGYLEDGDDWQMESKGPDTSGAINDASPTIPNSVREISSGEFRTVPNLSVRGDSRERFTVVGTVPEFGGLEFSLPVDNGDELLAWWRAQGITTIIAPFAGKPSIKIRDPFSAKCYPGQKIRHTIEVYERKDGRGIRGLRVEPAQQSTKNSGQSRISSDDSLAIPNSVLEFSPQAAVRNDNATKRLEKGMGFLKGQCVTHSNKPEWGIGKVLEDSGSGMIRVLFEHGGERKLIVDNAPLILVEGERAKSVAVERLDELPHLNIAKVKELCDQFYSEMKDNRRSTNDGKLALNVMRDLNQRRKLTLATRKQLAAWCHTNGTVFQRGVSIAQNISIAIFGRIIDLEPSIANSYSH